MLLVKLWRQVNPANADDFYVLVTRFDQLRAISKASSRPANIPDAASLLEVGLYGEGHRNQLTFVGNAQR